MSLRLVEIVIPDEHERTLRRATERLGVSHDWHARSEDGRIAYRFVIAADQVQRVVDMTQSLIEHADETRITVVPVELALPKEAAPQEALAATNAKGAKITREELESKLRSGAGLDADYLAMVVLSTVVAVIGLLSDNVAVVVGAMVIAPFLGPNLALAFATTMGDRALGLSAVRTLGGGLAVVIGLSTAIGAVWSKLPDTHEIATRTGFGMDAFILAVASGAAGVLALVGSAPMTLVGVMVAVALLPPASVVGLKLGAWDFRAAEGAALLLLVNIVGLNLSAKMVFTTKGISPRRWDRREAAQRSARITAGLWVLVLVLVVLLARRHGALLTIDGL